jgi:hypothetical protein
MEAYAKNADATENDKINFSQLYISKKMSIDVRKKLEQCKIMIVY